MDHRSSAVNVYGTDWCEDTQRTREHLQEMGVPYEYVNIEEDPAARQWVLQQNAGTQRTPTVNIGGLVLTEPDDHELEQALRERGVVG